MKHLVEYLENRNEEENYSEDEEVAYDNFLDYLADAKGPG